MTSPSQRTAKILDPSADHIREAALLLRRGEVIAMPTETVYGLAGNAFNPDALSKIFLAKERPTFDPLIVHVSLERATLADLMRQMLVDPEPLSDEAVKKIDRLIRNFWPGPLTLVLPKTPDVPDLATSGLDTVAIRAPKHPVARALIDAFGLPLCAPSANRFGRISPTSAQDVFEELGDRINLILDGGDCEIGLESTIVQITPEGEAILLRPGMITRQELEASLGSAVFESQSEHKVGTPALAPGRLASHYSPKKRLELLPHAVQSMMGAPRVFQGVQPKKIGLLVLQGKAEPAAEILSELLETPVIAETLSESGDWVEAAHHLFKKLRALDASDADYLLSEPVPEGDLAASGIAFAIADRLHRAAAPKGE